MPQLALYEGKSTLSFLVQRPSVPAGILLLSACLLGCQFLNKKKKKKSSLASCTPFSHVMRIHRVDGELPKEQDFVIDFNPELPTVILKTSIAESCRMQQPGLLGNTCLD